ncbi:MAG: BadF/BadG/BcrA/BcrD ATPase family protein [Pseudomonadota bacterium]
MYLGIDGGGTKCRARLEDADGRVLGEGLGGPANLLRGVEAVSQAVLDAAEQALSAAGLPLSRLRDVIAGLGLAGANVSSAYAQFLAWSHPFARMYLTSDLHIACLGAHAGADGAVMIIGTGFNAGIYTRDEGYELGGYGLLLGDAASGAGMGLQAVRHTFACLDGVSNGDQLPHRVLAALGCVTTAELLERTIDASPAVFAQLAPLVFELVGSDPAAQTIVAEAARTADAYARRLLADQPGRLSLTGGLAPALLPRLADDVRAAIAPALGGAEAGAVGFARRRDGVGC